ncbi:MAG: hypothetical protein GEV00_03170 [Actinophytocola sp.]|uniref:Uncharacterized protein n=1 Tax=Haloechinothrix salitolerans TaxID=926830 RepID=A0ABW2C9W3_9PSEU|nr:hypothetical protein [Actinophytocola sp.]MPY82319.1 hypothetical protein [Actinophytocola sp.]
MGVQGRKVVRMARSQRRGTCVSARALYARPMALRQLYTDAGTVIRKSQQEAAAAADQKNSR